LYLNSASVTFDACTITNNQVYNGDNWARRTAPASARSTAPLLLTNSILSGNRFANTPFSGYGGGAYVTAATGPSCAP